MPAVGHRLARRLPPRGPDASYRCHAHSDRCSRREAAFRQDSSARPAVVCQIRKVIPTWHAKFVGCPRSKQGNFYALLARIAPKQVPPREVGGDALSRDALDPQKRASPVYLRLTGHPPGLYLFAPAALYSPIRATLCIRNVVERGR
jgi:hypothetical protein